MQGLQTGDCIEEALVATVAPSSPTSTSSSEKIQSFEAVCAAKNFPTKGERRPQEAEGHWERRVPLRHSASKAPAMFQNDACSVSRLLLRATMSWWHTCSKPQPP